MIMLGVGLFGSAHPLNMWMNHHKLMRERYQWCTLFSKATYCMGARLQLSICEFTSLKQHQRIYLNLLVSGTGDPTASRPTNPRTSTKTDLLEPLLFHSIHGSGSRHLRRAHTSRSRGTGGTNQIRSGAVLWVAGCPHRGGCLAVVAKARSALAWNLSKMARQYLGTPATSASCERVFSTSGLIFGPENHHMTGESCLRGRGKDQQTLIKNKWSMTIK